jgi:hypothetical protein
VGRSSQLVAAEHEQAQKLLNGQWRKGRPF